NADALPLLFRNVQQLLLQAPALLDLLAQFGIELGQRRRSVGDAHFQFVPRLQQLLVARAQLLLGFAQLFDGPTQFLGSGLELLLGLFALAAYLGLTQLALDR